MVKTSGTPETQRFYNEVGWKQQDGASVDHNMFGATEDGPIRIELHHLHNARIRRALSTAGNGLNVLECGCGGNPERLFLDLCARYTAVDFSDTGMQLARASFADVKIPHRFQTGDVCALPLDNDAFDAVYCAHMIYHIEDPKGQETALAELIRVVRPGGIVVLILANPHPLFFPIRMARRIAAGLPLLGKLLSRLRAKPPLPYRPMPISWYRARMEGSGQVEVLGAGMPSLSFYRNVTEFKGVGRLLWKVIRWLDVTFPEASARLGNYVMITCRKAAHKGV